MSQICSKMVYFLFSDYFGGHLCYHSNGKSQIDTRRLHLGYCSDKNPSTHVTSGHYRHARETPSKWRFAGGPIVAVMECWLGFSEKQFLIF